MANEESLSRTAVRFVADYEMKNDRQIIDVQSNKNFKGFDLISISKDSKDIKTIEIKGTTRDRGIPDAFETEFSRNKKLIATHLYVVYFEQDNPKKLYIVPNSAIQPEHLKETVHYKFSSTFKTKILPKYEVPNKELKKFKLIQ
ncbi:MAG: hypothetical protein Q8O93_05320 [bacterium]|nr:hypothetical protein [bacterium]